MKFALTLAVILGLAMISQASIVNTTIGSITVDVAVDTATPASAGLTAYVVTLSSPLGIYSLDGRIDAVSGNLNQIWNGTQKTPTADVDTGGWGALTPQQQQDDTSILVVAGNRLDAYAPAENRPVAPNGTFLAGNNLGTHTMAFGLKDGTVDGYPLNLNSFPFARIVLNADSVASFNFKIVDGDSAFGVFNFNIPVPEPMTLSLLGAGALALIRRRR